MAAREGCEPAYHRPVTGAAGQPASVEVGPVTREREACASSRRKSSIVEDGAT